MLMPTEANVGSIRLVIGLIICKCSFKHHYNRRKTENISKLQETIKPIMPWCQPIAASVRKAK